MAFHLDDRVIVIASGEESKNEIFRQMDGKYGTITEIYYLDYQPETPRYEVTLDEPITAPHTGDRITTIPGLYEDNLRKVTPDKNDKNNNRERAVESFKLYESIINEASNSKWYYGMADCHGLIAFRPEPGDSDEWGDIDAMFDMGMIPDKAADSKEKRKFNAEINMMMHTARANLQRYSVVYRAKVSEEVAELVEGLLASSMYEEALELLKKGAEEVQVARGMGANAQNMWDKIPNPELNPMY